jgi:hypothetical protein
MLDFAVARAPTAKTSLREDAAQYYHSVWKQEHLDGEILPGSRSVIDDLKVQMVAAIPSGAGRDASSLAQDASVLLFLDDTVPNSYAFDAAWRTLGAAANLFQFVRHSRIVSPKGLGGVVYVSPQRHRDHRVGKNRTVPFWHWHRLQSGGAEEISELRAKS